MPYRPPIHQAVPWRPKGAAIARRNNDPYYQSAEWAAVRAFVLKRDHYRCQLFLPGCSERATIADHIVERKDGGADTSFNLRAVCAPCHNRRHPDRWRNRET